MYVQLVIVFRLTVKKDGPNKGREFYKCPKQPACNFFEWADTNGQNNSFGGNRPGGSSSSGGNFQNPPRNYGNNGDSQGQNQGQHLLKLYKT